MTRERGAVVVPLVAEKGAKRLLASGRCDQDVPVEVSALVAEMAEEGAIRLAELLTLALALDGVRLGDVDGDDAVEVAGGRAEKEIEREAIAAGITGVEW